MSSEDEGDESKFDPSPKTTSKSLKELGFTSEDIVPSLLYDDDYAPSPTDIVNRQLSTSTVSSGEEEDEIRSEEEEEDDYGNDSFANREQEPTPIPSTVLPTASSRTKPRDALGPQARRIRSLTISRLESHSSSPASVLSPTSARPIHTSPYLRSDSGLDVLLARSHLLGKFGRGLTERETREVERAGKNVFMEVHSEGELEARDVRETVKRLLRDDHCEPTKRPPRPRATSNFSSSSNSPNFAPSALPLLERAKSRPSFVASHLAWTGSEYGSIEEPIEPKTFTTRPDPSNKMEDLTEEPIELARIDPEPSMPARLEEQDEFGAPHDRPVSNPDIVESRAYYRSSYIPPPSFSIPTSHSYYNQAGSRPQTEEQRPIHETSRIIDQRRPKPNPNKKKEEEEDPRQREIQKRLADQKRRSELMHSKIEARKPPPSKSKPKESRRSSKIPFESIPHSSSRQFLPPTWIASPTRGFAPTPIPTSMPFYQSPPRPAPIFAPLASPLASPLRPAPSPIPTAPRATPQAPQRSSSTPILPNLPPRNLVVVPPPPPAPNPISNYDDPFSSPRRPPSFPHSSSTHSIDPKDREKEKRRSKRMSLLVSEPLVKGVRPPAAWSLPHSPSVSGRKTKEQEK
ncbi:uncharacterized protein JCM6883_007283 [Sporobolomyces salmoneus]|uniref:uncharacterized protein n=1 Tax=Sporobolomyces salmoneus TaxID=183962 RepID=UPI00316B0554